MNLPLAYFRWWQMLLLGLGLTIFPWAGWADVPQELHTAEEIRRLSPTEADRRYPVRIRGIITFFDDRIPAHSFRFIQDDTAGIYYYVDGSPNNPTCKVGQMVEIQGVTGAGSFAPVITAQSTRILGEGKLPEPKSVPLEDLVSGREDSQFVEVRGIVRAVWGGETNGYYFITLATGQGHLTVMAEQLGGLKASQLVDCELRVSGVCMSRFNSQRQLFDIGLVAPRPEDLVIERPAPVDPWAVPQQPLKSLLQFTWGGTYGHRVRVRGKVTLHYGTKLYIQDETEGLCIDTKEAGDLHLGDEIEALGFPAKGEYTPVLQNGICRRIKGGPEDPAEKITPDEALSGNHDCRLVQIEATLLDQVQHSKEPFLVLVANGFVFHAQLTTWGQNVVLGNLQNGSKVLVNGVCVIDRMGEEWHSGPDWRADSFKLYLRNPKDVTVLKAPPWWNLTKLLWAIGLLWIVIMAVFFWVIQLRRRVNQQTKIIAEKLRAEAALKERYVELFENANDMVFTHDHQGRITSLNKAGERLLQRSRNELLGQELASLMAEEERPAAREWVQKTVAGEETPASDWDFLNAAGQRLKLEVSTRLVEQGGQFIEVEGVARDITDRKRMEKEILEISSREQQRLGHDLHDGVCQQLAAIAYRAHILARQLESQQAKDSAEAAAISDLINESLVQTRSVARGLFPVRLEEDGLVAAVEELAVNAAKIYNIAIHFAAGNTLPSVPNTVAMHLHFIAQEAILNAAKHSQGTTVRVKLEREGDDLVLGVQDNGVGIPPATPRRSGMGIGVMRYRAKAIGAALEIQTQPGTGTRITCRLRLHVNGEGNQK